MEEVIVTVETNGNAKVVTKGFKGPACKLATKEFEEALGKKVSDTNTQEMYEQPNRVAVKNRA